MRRLLPLLALCLFAAACSDASAPAANADASVADGSGSGSGQNIEPRTYPLDDTLRINELAMRCTHNSYHIQRDFVLDASHDYTHQPLDVQLGELGVRAFEIDIHAGTGFPVFHIPIVDNLTTCSDLGRCLGTIAGWSARNPDHTLVVVWIEVKDELDGRRITNYELLDETIRTALGPILYSPDDLQGDFASPRARIDQAGWPTLGETRGRVALVLLDVDDPHSAGYTNGHTTTAGRAMFARADNEWYAAPWAVFAKVNNPSDAASIAAAHAANLMIASNVGGAGSDDASNAAGLADALTNGSHMLCDDFPAPVANRAYFLDLPGGTPSRCNQVTGSALCRPDAIEARPVVVQLDGSGSGR